MSNENWDTVLPKLTSFWRLNVLLKYPRALAHTEMSPNPETGRCRINEACPLSSYHLSCLKLRGVPKKWQCPLCHKNPFTQELKKLGEQWWRSGESTPFPPMWPGFDFQTRRHTWVEFVGSLLCSEMFFPGYSGFPLFSKTCI